MPATYLDAITTFYPTRRIQSSGDGYDYDALVATDDLPLPAKADLDQKALTLTIEAKWREIQAERDKRKFGGVRIGTRWFHSDNSSRIQQIGLVMMGANLPLIQWKTLDNSFVTMTPTLAMQIFQTTAASDIAIFAIAEQHKVAMSASANPANYDFSGGWPLTFGG